MAIAAPNRHMLLSRLHAPMGMRPVTRRNGSDLTAERRRAPSVHVSATGMAFGCCVVLTPYRPRSRPVWVCNSGPGVAYHLSRSPRPRVRGGEEAESYCNVSRERLVDSDPHHIAHPQADLAVFWAGYSALAVPAGSTLSGKRRPSPGLSF